MQPLTASHSSSYHHYSYSHAHQHSNQQHQHTSGLSNLSLIYLKKSLSNSSSFQNKVNLYSNNRLVVDTNEEELAANESTVSTCVSPQMNDMKSSSAAATTTATSTKTTHNGNRRPASTHLNAANINRFIGPKLAVSASSTSTCSLSNAGLSAVGYTSTTSDSSSHKPPLPHSKSAFSKSSFKVYYLVWQIMQK